MKRIGIIAACILMAGLLVTFIGFPYRYHHESYRGVGETPALAQLELVVQLVPDAWENLLGAPVKTGGPYGLSITAYGNKCCDRRLVLHSVVLENHDGTHLALLDEEQESDFSAREIWLTNIYPKQRLALSFEDGTELKILLDMSLITTSGEVRKTLERKFRAKLFAGFSLFPLYTLLYA